MCRAFNPQRVSYSFVSFCQFVFCFINSCFVLSIRILFCQFVFYLLTRVVVVTCSITTRRRVPVCHRCGILYVIAYLKRVNYFIILNALWEITSWNQIFDFPDKTLHTNGYKLSDVKKQIYARVSTFVRWLRHYKLKVHFLNIKTI